MIAVCDALLMVATHNYKCTSVLNAHVQCTYNIRQNFEQIQTKIHQIFQELMF